MQVNDDIIVYKPYAVLANARLDSDVDGCQEIHRLIGSHVDNPQH